MIDKKILFRLLTMSCVLGLTACQSTTGCLESNTQCFGSSSKLFKSNDIIPDLKPGFNYIRFNMNGNVAWLAQGGADQWPRPNTNVYYSADRSVFKWSHGRLIAISHQDFDWRERINAPINWQATLPIQFTREVNTVDGKIAVKEQRELKKSPQPNQDDYVGSKDNLVWMHEYTIAKSPAMEKQPSYDSWYAFDSTNLSEPVYGQHCISEKYCTSWQVWKKS